MDKAELSRLLEQQVQEKLKTGYTITTYALDAASRDKLKRDLKPHAQATHHDDDAHDLWDGYVHQLENGTYVPESPPPEAITPSTAGAHSQPEGQSCSSAGIWKVRRH